MAKKNFKKNPLILEKYIGRLKMKNPQLANVAQVGARKKRAMWYNQTRFYPHFKLKPYFQTPLTHD